MLENVIQFQWEFNVVITEKSETNYLELGLLWIYSASCLLLDSPRWRLVLILRDDTRLHLLLTQRATSGPGRYWGNTNFMVRFLKVIWNFSQVFWFSGLCVSILVHRPRRAVRSQGFLISWLSDVYSGRRNFQTDDCFTNGLPVSGGRWPFITSQPQLVPVRRRLL